MTRVVLFLLALAMPLGASAATIRSVFVGIDKYRYSNAPENDFDDLEGAVSDVGRTKAALQSAYGIDVGPTRQRGCPNGAGVSVTLIDNCATKKAILAALDRQIAAAAKGDTLIFFFAGHGSQTDDGSLRTQVSGRNSTILPVDARSPDATVQGDILDHDIRVFINRAVAKGVNFVSIFDSCHSGTGARGMGPAGRKRSAPPLPIATPADVAVVAGPGYWVHFGASTDDEQSYEVPMGGGRHGGLFTDAFVKTIAQPRLAGATFGDIATAVQLAVRDTGRTDQHPQVEGALNATLGGANSNIPLVDVEASGTSAKLAAGRLAGVTMGSVYALFPDRARAIAADPQPVATGRVTALDDFAATLTLDRTASGLLRARETDHAFGDRQLRLGFALDATREAAFKRDLATLPFVSFEGPPQLVLSFGQSGQGMRHLLTTPDGGVVEVLPSDPGPSLIDALAAALRRVARVQAMLALRSDPAKGDVDFCLDNAPLGAAPCAPVTGRYGRVLESGKPVRVRVFNATDRPRHFYVFGIDAQYNVRQILPIVGVTDEALSKRRMLPQNQQITPRSAGNYLFMVLASDTPINAAALEQNSGARSVEACGSTLARLLCDANGGTRDATVPAVGDWSAIVLPARVVAPGDPMLEGKQ
ncbi:caspase family protein [Sphingomonas sp. SUN039]|uniref:caspase family protein n=1 Tax=Sphingomonas sp. SUN039 TaxID=2937787 RepID=UPI002164E492|nr:caspase family protein [Sphingomonas sp. SUN039]UVO54716.1 caspase family protein [Sphingomonas sp. SUN039]